MPAWGGFVLCFLTHIQSVYFNFVSYIVTWRQLRYTVDHTWNPKGLPGLTLIHDVTRTQSLFNSIKRWLRSLSTVIFEDTIPFLLEVHIWFMLSHIIIIGFTLISWATGCPNRESWVLSPTEAGGLIYDFIEPSGILLGLWVYWM